jgi:hypothetical protein
VDVIDGSIQIENIVVGKLNKKRMQLNCAFPATNSTSISIKIVQPNFIGHCRLLPIFSPKARRKEKRD